MYEPQLDDPRMTLYLTKPVPSQGETWGEYDAKLDTWAHSIATLIVGTTCEDDENCDCCICLEDIVPTSFTEVFKRTLGDKLKTQRFRYEVFMNYARMISEEQWDFNTLLEYVGRVSQMRRENAEKERTRRLRADVMEKTIQELLVSTRRTREEATITAETVTTVEPQTIFVCQRVDTDQEEGCTSHSQIVKEALEEELIRTTTVIISEEHLINEEPAWTTIQEGEGCYIASEATGQLHETFKQVAKQYETIAVLMNESSKYERCSECSKAKEEVRRQLRASPTFHKTCAKIRVYKYQKALDLIDEASTSDEMFTKSLLSCSYDDVDYLHDVDERVQRLATPLQQLERVKAAELPRTRPDAIITTSGRVKMKRRHPLHAYASDSDSS